MSLSTSSSYRLRRYVHQYESYIPLTDKSDYEKHFQNWLGIGNNSNSLPSNGNISSQESVKILSSNSSTNTNELFETLYLAPKSQDIGQNAQTMSFLDHEEDTMPPLMFEDESDSDQKSEKTPSPQTSKKSEIRPKKDVAQKNIDKDEKKRQKLASMLEINFTSKYQVNKSILKKANKVQASDKQKPSIIKKEVKRLSPVKMLLPIREPKLKTKPVNKQLEKLKKLLDIDCTPKHQFNKNVFDEIKKEDEDEEEALVSKKKETTEKKKPRIAEKKKELSNKKKKAGTEVSKSNQTNKKQTKPKLSQSPEELKRKRLERLLEIDFTPKYQLNNIKRKSTAVPKSRDLKETPKERKRVKERDTPVFQNAQKMIESASPDTTTQDFIHRSHIPLVHSNELLSLDIDKEIEKLKTSMADVIVEEPLIADVIVLSDDTEDEDDEFVKSPDIFGGRMDELITDDDSINCSQTLPLLKTQIPPNIKPAKPKNSSSCLQQLESQDLSSDGHNFMDVYSEFLQAQKSNESSPFKSTTNNNKPIATGNKITKYFGGTSSAVQQAREILKTPTRRKSFSGTRRSPKTPPNIQNNNIMTWLVRPSSSSSADHQDSAITSSCKDIKRRRLDY